MKISVRQKRILFGMILGDAYLQKTGAKNARLRVEHSQKQECYINWKYEQLIDLFQRKPKQIARIHPLSKKKYHYLRLQSHASPYLGKLRRAFYNDQGARKIGDNLGKFLKSRLTLAVWFMDDGYYYKRDKSAHIYLPFLSQGDFIKLLDVLEKNYSLQPKYYCRPDKKGCQLNFTGKQKDLLFKLIRPYILECFNYKLPLTP